MRARLRRKNSGARRRLRHASCQPLRWDLSEAQWRELGPYSGRPQALPFLDMYQGMGTGSLRTRCHPVFARSLPERWWQCLLEDFGSIGTIGTCRDRREAEAGMPHSASVRIARHYSMPDHGCDSAAAFGDATCVVGLGGRVCHAQARHRSRASGEARAGAARSGTQLYERLAGCSRSSASMRRRSRHCASGITSTTDDSRMTCGLRDENIEYFARRLRTVSAPPGREGGARPGTGKCGRGFDFSITK